MNSPFYIPFQSLTSTASAGVVASVVLSIGLTFSPGPTLQADELTYVGWGDPNLGWFAENAWEDEDQQLTDWTSGSAVTIVSSSLGTTASEIIPYTASTAVDVMELRNNLSIQDSTATTTLTLTGGEIFAQGGGRGAELAGLQLIGDFTKTGAGILSIGHQVNAISNFYQGTATVNAGTLVFLRLQNVMGPDSNFVVNDGGTLQLRFSAISPMGHMTVNEGGSASIGRTNGDDSMTVGMASLSGTGGTLFLQGRTSSTSTNPEVDNVVTVPINQSIDTTFAGSLVGLFDNSSEPTRRDNVMVLQKSGVGALTLAGSILLVREVTVSGGHLYINSAAGTTDFSSRTSSTAIHVNGGTLGGTGTITITDDSSIVLSATGRLAAGIEGVAGRTTIEFSGGGLDLSLASGSDGGWLKFDLGSAAVAGDSYDQILMTGGVLDIGDGLNFADFDFNLLSGFGAGTYVLFDTDAAILGSLGDVFGTLNDLDAELAIEGNNLVLQVIPEPASLAAIFGIAVLVVSGLYRRR